MTWSFRLVWWTRYAVEGADLPQAFQIECNPAQLKTYSVTLPNIVRDRLEAQDQPDEDDEVSAGLHVDERHDGRSRCSSVLIQS